MKRQLLLTAAVLLVLGLSAGAFAYKQTNLTVKTAMSCGCCKGDSCPMKKKDSSGMEESCCDKCDCCKGDSCPMKTKGGATEQADYRIHGVTVTTSSESCNYSCCNHKKDN